MDKYHSRQVFFRNALWQGQVGVDCQTIPGLVLHRFHLREIFGWQIGPLVIKQFGLARIAVIYVN